MTKNGIISFRSTYSKKELQRRFGNVSRRLNDLIDEELGRKTPGDWREILKRPAPKISEAAYELCLRPE